MAKLSAGRKFGGISLILIGFFFLVFLGFGTLLFGTSDLVALISIFFGNIPPLIFVFGLVNIIFGLLLIWAGRTIRNESFFPDFMGMMK